MARADFAELSGMTMANAGTSGITYGASRGVSPAPGVSGCLSVRTWIDGARFGLYSTPQLPNTSFNPTTLGADIRAWIRCVRGPVRPFVYVSSTGETFDSHAYIAGLCRIPGSTSSRLILAKGRLDRGPMLESIEGELQLLNTGRVVPEGQWLHVRLMAEVGDDGRVRVTLAVDRRDPPGTGFPDWSLAPGARPTEEIEAADVALVGGRSGFGALLDEAGSVASFTAIELLKELQPAALPPPEP